MAITTLDDLLDLSLEVWSYVHEQAKSVLSERQYLTHCLIFRQGFTPSEMERLLSTEQGAAWRMIHGNRIATGPYQGRIHGGTGNKIRKTLLRNADAQKLWLELVTANAARPELDQVNLKRLQLFFPVVVPMQPEPTQISER